MSTPGFTADASLYESSAHYRTGRHAGKLPAQVLYPIYPAMIGEETIDVVGCPPGFLQIGQGENTTCWPLPQTENPVPGEPPPGPGGGDPMETGPRGPGTKPPPHKPPKGPPKRPPKDYHPKKGRRCHAEVLSGELGSDVIITDEVISKGIYKRNGKTWQCCEGEQCTPCAIGGQVGDKWEFGQCHDGRRR